MGINFFFFYRHRDSDVRLIKVVMFTAQICQSQTKDTYIVGEVAGNVTLFYSLSFLNETVMTVTSKYQT